MRYSRVGRNENKLCQAEARGPRLISRQEPTLEIRQAKPARPALLSILFFRPAELDQPSTPSGPLFQYRLPGPLPFRKLFSLRVSGSGELCPPFHFRDGSSRSTCSNSAKRLLSPPSSPSVSEDERKGFPCTERPCELNPFNPHP